MMFVSIGMLFQVTASKQFIFKSHGSSGHGQSEIIWTVAPHQNGFDKAGKNKIIAIVLILLI